MTVDLDLDLGPAGTLLAPPSDRYELPEHLWGFGGVHGGLTLALLVRSLHEAGGDAPLRLATGRFHRPVRSRFEVVADPVRGGRSTTVGTARAQADGRVLVAASATFAPPRRNPVDVAPPPPPAPPPETLERFRVPTEFVPFARWTDIRPVGPNRPFVGAAAPELTAWIRLVEDDAPPTPERLVVLLDALAPSYSAVLTEPTAIPTVELTVQVGSAVDAATSPWALVHATTRVAHDGWLTESIDAWTPTGGHLGSATQLRVVAGS